MSDNIDTALSLQEPVGTSAETTDMITVIEHLYFQPKGMQPVDFSTRFSRKLKSSKGEAFVRRVKVKSTWAGINLLWVESAGCIVIRNESKHLIQVRFGETKFTMNIFSKDMLRLHTPDWNELQIKCDEANNPDDLPIASVFVIPE